MLPLLWLLFAFLGVMLLLTDFWLSKNTRDAIDDRIAAWWVLVEDTTWKEVGQQDAELTLNWIYRVFAPPKRLCRFVARVAIFNAALTGLSLSVYFAVPYKTPLLNSWETTPPLIVYGILCPTIVLGVFSLAATVFFLSRMARSSGVTTYAILLVCDLIVAISFFHFMITSYGAVEQHIAEVFAENLRGAHRLYNPLVGISAGFASIIELASNPFGAVSSMQDGLRHALSKYPNLLPTFVCLVSAFLATLAHLAMTFVFILSKTLTRPTKSLISLLLLRIHENRPVLRLLGGAFIALALVAEPAANYFNAK